MNNVAVTYSALGRHAEARELHEQTLELRLKKLGRDHAETLKSMNALAWILATAPEQKLRDPAKALELAEEAVCLAPEEGDYWNTLGAARYRVGEWQGAVEALTESVQRRKGGDGSDWFFLAMAHWQLGDRDQGRECYDRAVRWMEKHKPRDEELRQFRAEAAELLEVENN
jgi:tetratricopeptide (TPR) repeat protein